MNKSINPVDIVSNFKVNFEFVSAKAFGSGHINDTYLVKDTDNSAPGYLLQKINHHIFKDVYELIRNIWLVTNHLRAKYKALGYDEVEKRVLRLIPCVNGDFFYKDEEGSYWRMYYYLDGTKTYDVVSTEKQAYEGGKAFGRFQSLLSDLPAQLLSASIPDFLNMEKRLKAFENAVLSDPKQRVTAVEEQIRFIRERAEQMCYFQQPENTVNLPLRITHNDTKFNNVLLNQNDEAQCVIDLDTAMPGYVAYDFGDAIRSIINTAAEDEKDLEKINLDMSLFTAYTEGYLAEAITFITSKEIDSLMKGVMLLPYMQAVRFLTDYLEGDQYYKIHSEDHNLQRTNAQIQLVRQLEENEEELASIIQQVKANLVLN